MSYQYEKSSGDIIISGWEQGIASSPHKGIGNIQNANITTENGEVMCNFGRTNQIPVFTTASGAIHAATSGTLLWTDTNTPFNGQCIQVQSGSTITNFTQTTGSGNGPQFFIVSVSGTPGNYTIQVSKTYGGVVIGNLGTTGTATVSNQVALTTTVISQPIAGCYEIYFNGTAQQYRYYLLDNLGLVWIQDTGVNPNTWGLIDIAEGPTASGIAVLNGYLHVFFSTGILYKETCGFFNGTIYSSQLGVAWATMTNSVYVLNTSFEGYKNPHFALVGHEAALNYTDGAYIGTIIPFSTSSALNANVASYGSYTGPSSNVLAVSNLFGGSFPVVGETITFTTAPSGTMDSGISANTVYYVIASGYNPVAGQFKVSSTVGGLTVSWSGNGTGEQYFNSYNPFNGNVGGTIEAGGTISGGNPVSGSGGYTYLATPQACTCPQFEVTTALAELGASLVIGCQGSTLYQWDQVSLSPTNFVPLPENNCTFLLTANNAVYVFQGFKGNVYVTNGSSASIAFTVPDYLAGIAGTASTYIEPVFQFGQAFQARGRIFFSIQDQTATKTGNCGGIYSFVPSFYNSVTGEDVGAALRCENQNSYGNSNGLANVLIPNQQQNVVGVQYFAGWTSSLSSPLYGIDMSSSLPTATATIETDTIPTGTILGEQKKTMGNVEFKLAAPLSAGESVVVNFRTNLTDSWKTTGIIQYDKKRLAGVISTSNIGQTQWLQLQMLLNSSPTNPTFVRLSDLRIRTT